MTVGLWIGDTIHKHPQVQGIFEDFRNTWRRAAISKGKSVLISEMQRALLNASVIVMMGKLHAL